MCNNPEVDLEPEDEGDAVDVVEDDRVGPVQIPRTPVEDEDDEVGFMQREQVDRHDRWRKMLTACKGRLTAQTDDRKRSHVHQLRARLFHIIDPNHWTGEQDQFFALLQVMEVAETVQTLGSYAGARSFFISCRMGPGPEMSQQMMEEEIAQHPRDEDEWRKQQERENELRQQEAELAEAEENMLQGWATLYSLSRAARHISRLEPRTGGCSKYRTRAT